MAHRASLRRGEEEGRGGAEGTRRTASTAGAAAASAKGAGTAAAAGAGVAAASAGGAAAVAVAGEGAAAGEATAGGVGASAARAGGASASRRATGVVSAARATGASAAAARGAVRAATARSARATVATAARAQDRGRGAAGLWSPDSRVAPSWGACYHPGRATTGGRCHGASMRHAHTGGSPVRDQRYISDIEGIAPGFLHGQRPWEDLSAGGGDEARTFGGGNADEAGTWRSLDHDGQFPSLVNLFLRHGGSLKIVQDLIRGVKACTEEEMEHWGPGGSVFEPPLLWMSPIS